MKYKNSPRISVITVSYNAVITIEQTISSVINQTYDNIEYIIIDGGSTDGTIDIIKKFEDTVTYWISEPDRGIYDAMNKGIRISKGDYIFFLNAGDMFFSSTTVSNVVNWIKGNSEKEVILGSIKCVYEDKVMGIVKSNLNITPWYTPPHQGMFVQGDLYRKNLYFTELSILGDREFFLRLNKYGLYKVSIIDEIIAIYDLKGVSSDFRNALIVLKESLILWALYGKSNFFMIFLQVIKMLLKYIISFFISQKICNDLLYKLKVHLR